MKKSIASVVLKVMMVWLLVMYSYILFRSTLLKELNNIFGYESSFFIGAILSAAIISLIAIVAIAVRKKGNAECATARINYAGAGMMLSVFGILMISLGICYDPVMQFIFGAGIQSAKWYDWMRTIAITDVICLAAVMLLACKIEKTPVEKHKMTVGQFIACIFMNSGVIGAGMIIGMIMEKIMEGLCGTTGGQVITDMMLGSDDFWRILTVGIGAPIVEELIFRKFLIDRIHKYGEGIAILISGMLFGLFHGNFAQFFHTTGVGLFLAFIYIRTGKVWYTILLHMVVNMCTSVITMKIVSGLDFEKMELLAGMDASSQEAMDLTMELLPSMLGLIGWFLILVATAVIGWGLWIMKRKQLFLKKAPEHVEKKKVRTALLNFGMIYFLIMAIIRFISFYL